MAQAPHTGARVEPELIDAARSRCPELAEANTPTVVRYAVLKLAGLDPSGAFVPRGRPRKIRETAA